MEAINLTKNHQKVLAEFQQKCNELGSDDGFIKLTRSEYEVLLKYYKPKKSWFWDFPEINGFKLLVQPIAK